MTMIKGQTGDYIKSLKRNALMRTSAGATGSVGSFGAAWAIGLDELTKGGILTLMVGALIIAGVAFASLAQKHWKKYGQASVGLRSEQRVVKVLKRSGAAVVVNGALLGAGGDADHIVLGPVCAVVETKTGTGRVRTTPDGGLIAGNRRIPKSPVAQATRQAAALARKAGVRAEAIVCVVDMKGPAFQTRGTWVCSLDDLTSVLARLPQVMSAEHAQRVAANLDTGQ